MCAYGYGGTAEMLRYKQSPSNQQPPHHRTELGVARRRRRCCHIPSRIHSLDRYPLVLFPHRRTLFLHFRTHTQHRLWLPHHSTMFRQCRHTGLYYRLHPRLQRHRNRLDRSRYPPAHCLQQPVQLHTTDILLCGADRHRHHHKPHILPCRQPQYRHNTHYPVSRRRFAQSVRLRLRVPHTNDTSLCRNNI